MYLDSHFSLFFENTPLGKFPLNPSYNDCYFYSISSFNYGIYYFWTNNEAKAKKFIKKSLFINPRFPNGLNALRTVYN